MLHFFQMTNEKAAFESLAASNIHSLPSLVVTFLCFFGLLCCAVLYFASSFFIRFFITLRGSLCAKLLGYIDVTAQTYFKLFLYNDIYLNCEWYISRGSVV